MPKKYIHTSISLTYQITIPPLLYNCNTSAIIFQNFSEKRYCSQGKRKPSAGPGSGVSLLGQQSTYLCSRTQFLIINEQRSTYLGSLNLTICVFRRQQSFEVCCLSSSKSPEPPAGVNSNHNFIPDNSPVFFYLHTGVLMYNIM